MKSARGKMVAFTWLHGGHHTAPQYRNSGLPLALACSKAPSTSASVLAFTQLMPSCALAWAMAVGAAEAAEAAADAGSAGAAAGSGFFEQAQRRAATATAVKRAGARVSSARMGVLLETGPQVSRIALAPSAGGVMRRAAGRGRVHAGRPGLRRAPRAAWPWPAPSRRQRAGGWGAAGPGAGIRAS